MKKIGDGYALDFLSPIQHVANALETARLEGRAVSMAELVSDYKHPVSGDLARVQQHHGCESAREALRFLIEQAVLALGRNIEATDDGYRLTRPLEKLRYPKAAGVGNRTIKRYGDDPHAILHDQFNQQSGKWSDNIRSRRVDHRDTMDELRASMRAFGWIEELPAIQDERGVVLVGHRRLAVAKELGIPPVIQTLVLGSGDAGDTRRVALAIGSNEGHKPFTKEDRAQIAEILYGSREWSMERIGELLHVSTQTVSRDLNGHFTNVKSGRAGRKPKPTSILDPEHESTLAPEDVQVVLAMAEQGINQREIAKAIQKSEMPVRAVINRERGRREVLQAQSSSAPPCICPTCGAAHPLRNG